MTEINPGQNDDKRIRVRRQPKPDSVIRPTFATSRQSGPGNQWEERDQQGSLLKRRCACGTHTIGGRECDRCRQQRAGSFLQRSAVNFEHNMPRLPLRQSGDGSHDFSRNPASTSDLSGRQVEPRERGAAQSATAGGLEPAEHRAVPKPDNAMRTNILALQRMVGNTPGHRRLAQCQGGARASTLEEGTTDKTPRACGGWQSLAGVGPPRKTTAQVNGWSPPEGLRRFSPQPGPLEVVREAGQSQQVYRVVGPSKAGTYQHVKSKNQELGSTNPMVHGTTAPGSNCKAPKLELVKVASSGERVETEQLVKPTLTPAEEPEGESYYVAAGTYKTGNQIEHNGIEYNHYFVYTDEISRKLAQGEQEHCDDISYAYRISAGALQDVIETADILDKEATEGEIRAKLMAQTEGRTQQEQRAIRYILASGGLRGLSLDKPTEHLRKLLTATADRDRQAWHAMAAKTSYIHGDPPLALGEVAKTTCTNIGTYTSQSIVDSWLLRDGLEVSTVDVESQCRLE